jgi:hypothetical protein
VTWHRQLTQSSHAGLSESWWSSGQQGVSTLSAVLAETCEVEIWDSRAWAVLHTPLQSTTKTEASMNQETNLKSGFSIMV